MTIEERKNIILAKIAEMKANGEDMENALNSVKKDTLTEDEVNEILKGGDR